MSVFTFEKSSFLGNVVSVDTSRIWLSVDSEKMRHARVGRLVALKAPGLENWLIAIVERIVKTSFETEIEEEHSDIKEDLTETEFASDADDFISEDNKVKVALLGAVKTEPGDKIGSFSRSIIFFPDIESECYALEGKNLENLMGIISRGAKGEHALDIGTYTLGENARAYLDGNKFFQRHAALLGSTGSGKSWTVATILEKAAKLPTANIVLFDLHGEYKNLEYATQLRVAGPDDLNSKETGVLYLPYWLLNSEEMQSFFVDRSEFSAHNQVMVFQDEVVKNKKALLRELKRNEVLNSFTVNSPVPFSLDEVTAEIKQLNEEMVQGARGLKQGRFFGQFSRFIARLESKSNDKRYGFLFQAPEKLHDYKALYDIADMLMGFKGDKKQIKVIDFSEVPSDVLPIIVGLVARIIFQIQFWTENEKRQPIALVCDEAHLYLPKKEDSNPIEKRAVENFERIAKEGRKYGVGLLVISQRPSDVSSTILSQCNNFIALRLTNAKDQTVVKELMPDSLESFMEILPILDIGEALIVGDAVLLPTRVKMDKPSEGNRPLSATIDFWDEWSEKEKETDLIKAIENMRKQSRR